MLQLIYVSSVRDPQSTDPEAILAVSRRNNRRDQVTGLLYYDGRRFLQALEGPAAAVEAAVARIQADARHRAIVILSRRDIAEREFGDWSMAYRSPEAGIDDFVAKVSQLVEHASPSVRGTFEGFAEARRAA
jgi:hypothetical protein